MTHSTEALVKSCKDPVVFDEAIKLIGDFWTLRIVDAIREDEVRFCEIERRMLDINPATLTGRLKKLEDAQMIDRRVETLDRQSVSYVLTERGRRILPVLESIKEFTNSDSV
ncbi:MAG: helix-turn-helix domain-containing protein [Patescibacteria group bacterium]